MFFQAIPLTAAGVPVSDQPFTRTGLLGFVGPVSVNEPSGALLCPDSQLLSEAAEFSRILCQGSDLNIVGFSQACIAGSLKGFPLYF